MGGKGGRIGGVRWKDGRIGCVRWKGGTIGCVRWKGENIGCVRVLIGYTLISCVLYLFESLGYPLTPWRRLSTATTCVCGFPIGQEVAVFRQLLK